MWCWGILWDALWPQKMTLHQSPRWRIVQGWACRGGPPGLYGALTKTPSKLFLAHGRARRAYNDVGGVAGCKEMHRLKWVRDQIWLNMALDLMEVKGKERGKNKVLSKSEQLRHGLFWGPLLAETVSVGEKEDITGIWLWLGRGRNVDYFWTTNWKFWPFKGSGNIS